jgi:hypothetical protein
MSITLLLSPLALSAAAPEPVFRELDWKVGECRFSRTSLSFEGTPVEQAGCLLRKVKQGGAKSPQPLPDALVAVLERKDGPTAAERDRAIAAFPEPYRSHSQEWASAPASRTEAGLPVAYFAIHDTSMPFLAERKFPRNLDSDPEINDFRPYFRKEPVAHVFLNRAGQIWGAHDLSRPWRATKLESYEIGREARGRMVHIEVVQPRRYAPGSTSRADTLGPRPGFSDAQYRMLAALYVYASARAGHWLIPGFHANIDAGIPHAHDDPQNFDLEKFGDALAALLDQEA